MILAIDTSAAQCAAALVSGATVHARAEPMERGHAERLMPMLAELLDAAGATWADLSAVAVCTGPGSFTGIRVGVAAARGIALGRAIPALGVGRLEALAHGRGAVRALAAGRGGSAFAQDFGADGAPLGPPAEGDAAELGALPHVSGEVDPVAIARIASARLAAGHAAGRPAPLYLRPADAAPSADLPPALLP